MEGSAERGQGQGQNRARDKSAGGNETAPDGAKDQKEAKERRAFFRRPIVLIVIALVVIGAAVATFFWWLNARNYEDTDDAFIDTHVVRIAAQVSGRITNVAVDDNQLVQAGQVLISIDAADPQARVNQASAQVAQAESQQAQAEAQIRVAEANHQQALAQVVAATAQADNAQRDLERYRALATLNRQAVAQQQLDQAETQARNTAAQRDAAMKQAQGVEAQIGAAQAQVKAAQAQIDTLNAQVAQAKITLGYTSVVAPIAGHIAQRNAAIGNYVAPGQQMLAIVPLQIWVTANFKETQLDLMRPGQPVDIHVDACPSSRVTGHVDSIQRGSGEAFALLPPENATGNYVKVVQRVPVKIVFDNVPSDCPLGPGMSVEPSVKVR